MQHFRVKKSHTNELNFGGISNLFPQTENFPEKLDSFWLLKTSLIHIKSEENPMRHFWEKAPTDILTKKWETVTCS